MRDDTDLAQELWRGLLRLAEDAGAAWDDLRDGPWRAARERLDVLGDEAAFHMDRAFMAALGRDPELVAEVRRAARRLRRHVERTLDDWLG